jgi:hypothetical protein
MIVAKYTAFEYVLYFESGRIGQVILQISSDNVEIPDSAQA